VLTDCYKQKRNDEIVQLFKSGWTMQEIGDVFGVCRERVRQILFELRVSATEGGCSLKTAQKAAKRDQEFIDLRGCDSETYRRISKIKDKNGKNPQRCYSSQRGDAIFNGIKWELNFYEWWTVWDRSGKWHKKGREKGEYCMRRHESIGPYSKDNSCIELTWVVSQEGINKYWANIKD